MSKSKGRKLAEWLRNLNASSEATTDNFADDAVTNPKIADDAVDTAQIADSAVHTANLADGNVTFGKLHTALVVTETDAISSNDNDTTIPTSAAVVDYISTYIAGNQTYGNITTTGYIAGPSTFTIDPAAVGDNTGTLVVAGNLQVDGTTTTINSTTMTVDDLNITLASGAANAAAANGAGITVDGASATLTYNGTNDDWNFNKSLNVDVGAPASSDQVLARFSSQNGVRDIGFVWDDSVSTLGIATLTNHALTFHTNGNSNERMRIDSSGNVGINTTPSLALGTGLHIKGSGYANLTLQKSASNVGHALEFTDENNAIQYRIGTNFASGGQNLLFAYGSTPAIGMMLDSAGKVGIGTSPSNLLHVDKDTGSTPTVYINNSGAQATEGLALKVQASGRGSGIPDVSIFSVHNITDELFTVRNDGNVGIGTDSPGKKLTVQSASSGDGIYLPNTNNAYPAASTGYTDIRATFYDYLTTGQNGGESIIRLGSENANSSLRTSYISFQTSSGGTGTSSERMRLTSIGRLGLGTTPSTPETVLDIKADGTIQGGGNGVINVRPHYGGGKFFNALRCAPSSTASDVLGAGLHIGAIDKDNALITSGNFYNSAGYYYNSHTTASGIALGGGQVVFYGNTGLTAGTYSYLPTTLAAFDGDGLKFNGDTATANALDDYEEGTWTPTIYGITSGMTYTSSGWYTIIGDVCHVWFFFNMTVSSLVGTNIRFNIPVIGKSGMSQSYQGGHMMRTDALTAFNDSANFGIYNSQSLYLYNNAGGVLNASTRFQTGILSGQFTYKIA